MKSFKKYLPDWFVAGTVLVIILAKLFPALAAMEKPVNLSKAAEYGISFIFFFYGVKLTPRAFADGLKNWKMHILIQSSTFILFPLIAIAAKPFFEDQTAWLSFLFLAALPSTVSSSVVMVSIAKGNIPAAIFNASVSSFGGIFITPVWIGFFLLSRSMDFNASGIITKLIFQILLPVIAGMIMHPLLGSLADRHKKLLKYFDQSVVLLIIFTSFGKSFTGGIFSSVKPSHGFMLFAAMTVLFFLIFSILRILSRIMGLSYADAVTVIFCGSKKSLVHGAIISKVIFGSGALGGFMLIPIMFYHAIQIIIVSFIASRWQDKPFS